jgi:hypothetical protein
MSKFCRIDSATLFTQTVNSTPVLTVVSYIMGRITTPLLKLSITKLVIKVNKNDINYGRVHSPENRGDLLESCLHVHVVQFYLRLFFIRLQSSPKASNLSVFSKQLKITLQCFRKYKKIIGKLIL